MIDAAVQSEVRKFIEHWRPYLAISPVLPLDGSWLSVGVVDAITFALRKQAELGDAERAILRGAAAYLAVMTHDCWEKFGVSPVVEIGEHGVVVRAVSGPKLDAGRQAIAYVERDLTRLLADLPLELPVMSGFHRVLVDVENFVSPFAFGLFTGLLPTIDGPWAAGTAVTFAEQIEKVADHLARTCAQSYGRLFPDESLGQSPEPYLCGLIYPLTLMDEDMPLRGAVQGLLRWFDEHEIPHPSRLRFALHLTRLPDERISGVGFVFCAALGEPLLPEVRAWAQAGSVTISLLREAIFDVREHYGLGRDWLDKPVYDDRDIEHIKNEFRLGLFPWVKLPAERIIRSAEDAELKWLLKLISYLEVAEALPLVERMVAAEPTDSQLAVQLAYLHVVSGHPEKAADALRETLKIAAGEDRIRAVDVMGMVQLIRGELTESEALFLEADSLGSGDRFLKAEVKNNLAWLRLLRGDTAGALDLLNESFALDPALVIVMINRTTTLHQLKKEKEARDTDRELIRLAPLHRDVFRGLIFDPATA